MSARHDRPPWRRPGRHWLVWLPLTAGRAYRIQSAAYIRTHDDRIDICCHGWRWWPQHNIPEEVEREHIRLAVESLRRTVGVTDTTHLGWYGRYAPSVNSRRLLHEAGFRYDSDSYGDDMPYWTQVGGEPHLVIPYSIQNNDAHLAYGSMPGETSAAPSTQRTVVAYRL